jgi:glycosyltransferase involved in cell wall biosynthesis
MSHPSAPERPRLAVVTRTRDRPLLLGRAIASVAGQRRNDLIHVIVNDGGSADAVTEALARTPHDPATIRRIDRAESHGMEAASNLGIRSHDSDYICIHDDDDSWEPGFLAEMLGHIEALERGPGQPRVHALTCQSNHVAERIEADGVRILATKPYNHNVRQLRIQDLAAWNQFPPIGLIFSREIYDRVGGFDESLPVLGDWDFNLRMILEEEIHVLPRPLANYHHRVEDNHSPYSNSVIAGLGDHQLYNTILTNRYIRAYITGGRLAPLGKLYLSSHLPFSIHTHQQIATQSSQDRLNQLEHDLTQRLHELGERQQVTLQAQEATLKALDAQQQTAFLRLEELARISSTIAEQQAAILGSVVARQSAIEASRHWRITAPSRRILDLLRRFWRRLRATTLEH